MEWPQALQDKIEQEQIEPIEVLEITNQVNESDSVFRSVTDKPTKLPMATITTTYDFPHISTYPV